LLTLFESLHALLYLCKVSQCQLQVDDINVVKRVNLANTTAHSTTQQTQHDTARTASTAHTSGGGARTADKRLMEVLF
jgi:hypothetical protein